MRKLQKLILICCLLAGLFLTSACTGLVRVNPDRLELDKPYKFSAEIQHGDFKTIALFERLEAAHWEITFTSPESVEGVTMVYNSGKVTGAFAGIESNVSNGDGGGNVAVRVIDAFENGINGEGREVVSFGEEIKITSKAGTPAYSYELVLDKESLVPLRLTIQEASLSALFSE